MVPSLWDEVFGNVAIECMSCGCPVIASDVGGLGHIAKKGGIVFDRGNVSDLAARLETLLCDAELRKQLGHMARQAAISEYDWNIMGHEYRQLFLDLVDKKQKASG